MRSLGLIALLPLSAAAQCLVVGVSDGDTLTARCGTPGTYQQVKVRLAGIDAPEKAQPFGQRSKQSLSDLCFKQEAKLTPRDVDRYGRTVASVSCHGQDAGRHQVSAGMAWAYDKYSRGFEGLYILQSHARGERRGLWVDKHAIQPWEWRKAKREGREPVDASLM